MKKKMLFHQDNAPCHKLIATMAKLHEMNFELLHHPPYSPGLKTMLQEKRFGSNEEVIAETGAYFEAKDKFFFKKGIEILAKHLNECITFEGDYVDEWSRILPKSCCFISHPTNLLSDMLCKIIHF